MLAEEGRGAGVHVPEHRGTLLPLPTPLHPAGDTNKGSVLCSLSLVPGVDSVLEGEDTAEL